MSLQQGFHYSRKRERFEGSMTCAVASKSNLLCGEASRRAAQHQLLL
jgi:hypothetical protein